MTVHVEVHLHAGLLRFVPDLTRGIVTQEFPDGARIADVLAGFGFPADRQIIVGVDGQTARSDDLLRDGARIDLVPPIAGGACSLINSRKDHLI
jgi:sulfur carrier protein ThiS